MDAADPAFPRSTAYWWFGCKSANRGTLGNELWPFHLASNLDVADGDMYGDYGSHDNVGDIILDAGIKSWSNPVQPQREPQRIHCPSRISLLIAQNRNHTGILIRHIISRINWLPQNFPNIDLQRAFTVITITMFALIAVDSERNATMFREH